MSQHQMRLLLLLSILLLSCLTIHGAIVCYHCDSIALPECAQTLGEVGVLPFKECPTELTCAMSIVDTITYRGCGAETPTAEATYSKRCSSNLCNAGVYPPGRLKCHQCVGESCVAAPAGKPMPCRYHHEEDQCYTEISSASLAYRGCISDSNHTAAGTAQLCDINGCNGAQGARTLSCVSCDSRQGRGCKMDLFQLGSKCNVSLYEQCQQQVLFGQEQQQFCYTYRQLSRVVRGCSSELPAELEPHRAELVQCATEDNCNAGCLPQQRCLSCNSADLVTCRSNATDLSSTTCGSAEASSCYACEYADFNVRRGCGQPPTGDQEQLVNCYECEGNATHGCNSLDFTRCYRCSSDNAAGCANWERPGGIFIEQCEVPASPCLVLNHINGTTERGCQREGFNCSLATVAGCRSCERNFCNKGPYPEQRLWCHQCLNCDQVERGQAALPCGLAANEPDDQVVACLEFYDEHKRQVVRGCRSNGQLYYECLLRSRDKAGCRLCHTHGCNDTPGAYMRGILQLKHSALAMRSGTSKTMASIWFWIWLSLVYHYIKST